MRIIGAELQAAGIGFAECRATTKLVTGRVRILEFVALTPDDLAKFARWAADNDIDFDNARIATAAEVQDSREWS